MENSRENKTSALKKPFIFLSTWRSLPIYELISYILMYASLPMLAYGIQSYNWTIVKIIILTILTLYSGFFAALIWNDITDADIDAIAHPDRPIPGGRISKKNFFIIALTFSALTFIFALLINIWCLFLVGAAAIFVAVHNKFLKKIIKIPAYSEIFTPVQWIVMAIVGFFAVWSTVPISNDIIITMPIFGSTLSTNASEIQSMIIPVVFTYFIDVAHDLPEGIHDINGDLKMGVKTYATTFGIEKTIKVSLAMFFITGILGILLFIKTVLSPFFLILFLIMWLYVFTYYYKLLKTDHKNKIKMATIVGRKGFDFYLFSFDLIFIDIFLQLLLNHFNLVIF